MLYTILIILIVLALLGGFSTGGYGMPYFAYPGLGLVLIIIIVLLFVR